MKQSKQISPSLTSGRYSHSPLHALKGKKITAFIHSSVTIQEYFLDVLFSIEEVCMIIY